VTKSLPDLFRKLTLKVIVRLSEACIASKAFSKGYDHHSILDKPFQGKLQALPQTIVFMWWTFFIGLISI